ncbi:Nuclear cap-binding protein subunit 1 [Escovopsis weberi]|uniref:Nuclear cap-binding protein subunit 1 n=1 Tax=Escovopsis weberi TaxID=150374 RepID=A0A0M9VU67_ESCWE|nr:Nuclear cap-binding protein subunit 1 [Escovopsis weberi]
MADHDRRSSAASGRKRRYKDDDDQYDRRHQRRRIDPVSLAVKLRRQFLSLADSPLRRWSDEVRSIARLVADQYDDENLRDTFVALALQLVVEQPLKTPFVAAVVLVANALRPEAAELVLAQTASCVETSIGKGQWRDVKLYVKFLACLQSCLEGEGVFPLLEELFSRAADLQTASSEDTIGTEIVKIILLTIPYIMAAAPGQSNKQKAADLMDKTDIIASEPHALQALVDPYHPGARDDGAAPLSLCMLLQKQLQAEAAKDWELAFLPRPWQMSLEEIEFQDKLASAPKHALPAVSIPATVVAGPRPLFPESYFSVYADQEVESVPSTASLASSLIRDAVTDTINSLDFNRNATARFLIDLDCYFAEGTFVKRATPFDDLRKMLPGRSTWKPEDVAVDIVFSQLFQLPAPEHKLVYFHSVLTEACKLAPAAIAPSLGRAIRFLYNNSPRMDLQLSYRFLNWFSHHLSNFGFTWKWAEWSDDTSLPDLHPLKWFLLGALDKEVRLSFAQRIQKTLPDAYQSLIDPEKEKDVPDFKFSNPDTPFSSAGQEIGALLRRKAADEEFQPVVDSVHAQASERGLDPLLASTDVLVTAVCWVGSKSLSHALACIDRTKARLLDAGSSSPTVQGQIVTSVMTYWHAHPGIALSIIDKLVTYAVVTPAAVVDWALNARAPINGTRGGDSLAQPHVFELVSNIVARVAGRARHAALSPDADDETRQKEAAGVRDLLRAINDNLDTWAAAGTGDDEAMDGQDEGSMGRDALVRRWAQRWLRVFQRATTVEEAFVQEAAKARASGAPDGADAA